MQEKNNGIYSIKFRLRWLEEEVQMLERKIEFYDDLSFKVKGWAVVSWFALISYAITTNQWEVAIFAPLIPFLFMIVDASHKRYQIEFIERTRFIMKFLNEPDEFKKWFDEKDVLSFPVYDLLNIYGKGHQHDPKNQRWSSIWVTIKKASVSMVYWCLIAVSFVVLALLLIKR